MAVQSITFFSPVMASRGFAPAEVLLAGASPEVLEFIFEALEAAGHKVNGVDYTDEVEAPELIFTNLEAREQTTLSVLTNTVKF